MRLLKSTRTWILVASTSAVAALAAPMPTIARPEYAAATGQPCGICHVSPAGGGPRTPAGLAFAAIATHATDPAGAWAQVALSLPASPASSSSAPAQLPRTGGDPLPGPEGLLAVGALLLSLGALVRRAAHATRSRRA